MQKKLMSGVNGSMMITSLKNNGWKASCMPIKVGPRGFVEKSLRKALTDVGLIGATTKKAIRNHN